VAIALGAIGLKVWQEKYCKAAFEDVKITPWCPTSLTEKQKRAMKVRPKLQKLFEFPKK
jgi:hypothetical protein